jgi:hypothetical protein
MSVFKETTGNLFWAGIAQSFKRIAASWTVRGSKPYAGDFSALLETGLKPTYPPIQGAPL